MLRILAALSVLTVNTVRGADRQSTTIWPIFFSHLSPLVSYSPDGWEVTLASHNTSSPEAYVNMTGFGDGFIVNGNGTRNTEVLFPDAPGADRRPYIARSANGPPLIDVTGFIPAYYYQNVSFMLNQTHREEGEYMNIASFRIQSPLPISGSNPDYDDSLNVPANDEMFQYDNNAWEYVDSPTNQSTNVQFSLAGTNGEGVAYPYNTSVLSTSTVNATLRFEVPERSSLLQWYGTVGPDQGRYELRLIPRETPQFAPHPNNLTWTGENEIASNYETKGLAWLDPRVRYDVEIDLLEGGKRTDLHGISFQRKTQAGDQVTDWYTEPGSGSGLSGGQIAGIVIGSVAGAIILAGLLWFCCKRRRQKSASNGRRASDETAVDGRTGAKATV